MSKLIEAARVARDRDLERVRQATIQEQKRAEGIKRRAANLERYLDGYDYEMGYDEKADCFHVALRHPLCGACWLTFSVSMFSSDDEPIAPSEARELMIEEGRVVDTRVPLELTAAAYALDR